MKKGTHDVFTTLILNYWMGLKLCKAHAFTAGDRKPEDREPVAVNIGFKIHKFTRRNKPTDPRNVVIFPIFAEFGCETLGVVYCLPKMLSHFPGKYTIVIGWSGREYFYRHLVDEYWEMSEEFMWLREYSRAFHNVSVNLRRLEKEASKLGKVVTAVHLGNVAVFPDMNECVHAVCNKAPVVKTPRGFQACTNCKTVFPEIGLFARLPQAKEEALWLPEPSVAKMERAKLYLPDNAVGVTARRRKTWGRNLDEAFYERLINMLRDRGYNPVWIGEKATTMPCPFRDIVDYSSSEDAKDLETTLALVKQLKFTVQFWTASTRLAGIMGTPYIIFESPEQIWGAGQEGMRLNLLTRGHRKMVICHYKKVCEEPERAISLVGDAVTGIEVGDYEDIIGLVENKDFIKSMKSGAASKLGETCKT